MNRILKLVALAVSILLTVQVIEPVSSQAQAQTLNSSSKHVVEETRKKIDQVTQQTINVGGTQVPLLPIAILASIGGIVSIVATSMAVKGGSSNSSLRANNRKNWSDEELRDRLSVSASTELEYDPRTDTLTLTDHGTLSFRGRSITLADENAKITAVIGAESATSTEKLRGLTTFGVALTPMQLKADPDVVEQGARISFDLSEPVGDNMIPGIFHFDEDLGYWHSEPTEISRDRKSFQSVVYSFSSFTLACELNPMDWESGIDEENRKIAIEYGAGNSTQLIEADGEVLQEFLGAQQYIEAPKKREPGFLDRQWRRYTNDRFNIESPICDDQDVTPRWVTTSPQFGEASPVKDCVENHKDGSLGLVTSVSPIVPYFLTTEGGVIENRQGDYDGAEMLRSADDILVGILKLLFSRIPITAALAGQNTTFTLSRSDASAETIQYRYESFTLLEAWYYITFSVAWAQVVDLVGDIEVLKKIREEMGLSEGLVACVYQASSTGASALGGTEDLDWNAFEIATVGEGCISALMEIVDDQLEKAGTPDRWSKLRKVVKKTGKFVKPVSAIIDAGDAAPKYFRVKKDFDDHSASLADDRNLLLEGSVDTGIDSDNQITPEFSENVCDRPHEIAQDIASRSGVDPWTNPEKITFLYCHPEWVIGGIESTDWIVPFELSDGHWESLPFDGTISDPGLLNNACYNTAKLKDRGAPSDFISRLAECRPPETPIEYDNATFLEDESQVSGDDIRFFGSFDSNGVTYSHSLKSTGTISGWGHPYFEYAPSGTQHFGAILGRFDGDDGETFPRADTVKLLQYEDGTLTGELKINPATPVFIQREIRPATKKVQFVFEGYQNGNAIPTHGGLIIGSPKIW